MPLNFGHRSWTKPDGSTTEAWSPYTCAYCGADVSGAVIAWCHDGQGRIVRFLQCPKCFEGTINADPKGIHPGAAFGPVLQGLPADVESAYSEARRCLSVNATTAAEAMCRKILMHVAVDKGAKEGLTFVSYLDHLEQQGYITPPMRGWVKLIKDHGNESQHRLPAPDRARAEGTVTFTAQLLRIVYEMEYLAQQFGSATPKP